MNICVCGWYLDHYDEFYLCLHRVKHNVHIVSNRQDEYLKMIDLPYTVRENTGLEWGAYNHYLTNVWQGGDVLFCHDDIEILPMVVNNEIKEPEFIFDQIAKLDVDQAYIFRNMQEDAENRSQHGRMIFCSEKFLKKAKGFYFDESNDGDSENYNAGINAFHEQARKIGGKVHQRAYVPSFIFGKRGQL